MPANIEQRVEQKLKNGILTKTLFIKHLELEIWQLLNELKNRYELKSLADTVRFAIRRASGRI